MAETTKTTEARALQLIRNYQRWKNEFENARYEFMIAKREIANETFDHPDECRCLLCSWYHG